MIASDMIIAIADKAKHDSILGEVKQSTREGNVAFNKDNVLCKGKVHR